MDNSLSSLLATKAMNLNAVLAKAFNFKCPYNG